MAAKSAEEFKTLRDNAYEHDDRESVYTECWLKAEETDCTECKQICDRSKDPATDCGNLRRQAVQQFKEGAGALLALGETGAVSNISFNPETHHNMWNSIGRDELDLSRNEEWSVCLCGYRATS